MVLKELQYNSNLRKRTKRGISLKNAFLIIFISYFIGNFSSSYILGKIFSKKDIRNFGSGNAGATNALRVFGVKIGLLAFLLDLLKGIIATAIGNHLMGYNGALIAGIFVVVGHNWSIFLKFKGGKGIATSLGVMLYLNLPTTIVCTVIGVLVIAKTTSSMYTVGKFNFKFFLTTLILGLMAIFKHKSNIERLMNGEESKLGEKIK
mgnify:CR=1 FL=1